MRCSPRRAAWLLATGAVLACAGPSSGPAPYLHNRTDYESFGREHPGLLEPNYLPFMAWPVRLDGQDVLIFCRWPRDAFPLAVYVAEPQIPDEFQDELRPTPRGAFAAAVEQALLGWQAELEGLVSFRRAPSAAEAALVVRLIAEEAPLPDPGVKVLGTTPLGDACRAQRTDARRRLRRRPGRAVAAGSSDRVPVDYEVPELWIYVADEFGLLNPDQVERIAMHEIGHALGMRSHSPIPNDLMFQRVLEVPRRARLSAQDANSFLSLYALPNGTVYRSLAAGQGNPAAPVAPQGALELALAPHVDARRGFEIQLPQGWLRVDTPTGFVAVDGTTWDYAASLQLIERRFPSIDAYLGRHAAAHVGPGTVLSQGETRVAERPAFQLVVQSADGRLVDHTTLIETGDGRVLVAIADCAPEDCERYRPWVEASLATLEIWGVPDRGPHDRDYGREP